MNFARSLVLAMAAAAILGPAKCSMAAGITFNFTLPAANTTSAGVYDSSGALVRTLWRKVSYTSGAHSAAWDGNKDDGTAASAGTYTVKVLYNNVTYTWEGVIGNTDTSFTSLTTGGDAIWHAYDPINDMAIVGTNMFIANGYSEGNSNAFRTTTSAPNTPKQMVFDHNILDAAVQFQLTASDNTLTYFANANDGFGNSSCILAYNVSDNSEYHFANGSSFQSIGWGKVYDNAIDVTAAGAGNTSVNPPTGLAVEQGANTVLAVAHAGANQIRLFNKTTGASTGTITVTNPGKIAFNPNTNDLWVISGTSLLRFAGSTLGSTNTPVTTITGFTAPLAVGVDPRSGVDIVMVTDGGTSQQVKAYNSSGTSLWTLGTAGGYNATNGPVVTNTKFAFGGFPGFIAVTTDGSFWVGDPGNFRNLHFTAARAYVDQIAYLPGNYHVTADMNAPTRIITRNWMEYQIDYTKPLLPGDPQAAGGNGSWKLVKNWGVGIPSQYLGNNIGGGINTLATLSNGRVYGLVLNNTTGNQEVVELPASGPLRFTGIALSNLPTLYANGDLRNCTVASGVMTITNQTLTGFDASGNPQWGTATTLASAPAGTGDPFYSGSFSGGQKAQFPVTASNIVVSFNQSLNAGMHLGGIKVGTSSWAWEASPSATTWNYSDPTQQIGTYDTGDGINYGGNTVHALGQNIIYGFHGEGWQGGQTNQYMHFWDDGLFVGEFGTPYFASGINNQPAAQAGNTFTQSIVEANGNTYLWHNDESCHGGAHRWRIDGLSGIAELSGSGALNSTITLAGAPAAPTGLAASAGNAQISLSWTASAGATSYNVYRGTTAGGESATPIYTGITGTTKVDTGLTNGTAYYYKVKAVNASGASAYSNEASATPIATASIPYAVAAPTIDGSVDAGWSAATAYNINKLVNGTTTDTGTWKAMWDSSKLYLLVTVTDSSLINGTADYNGDSVELYLDADNSKSATYGANDFQYILGWGHSTISEYAHSATSGVTYAQTNITGGYRMEFAIPWSTLGVTPAVNAFIGIDAGIDDAASTTARAGQVIWFGTANDYANPSLFGTGTLAP